MQIRTSPEENVPPTSSASEELAGIAPRLIESWLPINEVSIEAVREVAPYPATRRSTNSTSGGPWRPLIASRAAVAASMLPIGENQSRFLANIGTSTEVVTARRQMDAIKAEGGWSKVSFPNKRASGRTRVS